MTSSVRHSKRMSQGLQEVDWGKELQWRSWFPRGVQLDDRLVIPDDEVEVLVEAFRRFCLEAVKIKVPGARIPLELRDAQLDTVRSWIKYRNTIALKARQIGFSTLTAAFSLWCALGWGDRQIYLLSRHQDASVSLLNKAKIAYKSLPEWARDRSPALIDRSTLVMTFDNGSFIRSSPTGRDPIRGETGYLVVCDEWASFENEEDTWASVEPVSDVGGRIIGLSTAKGEGSFFHRLYTNAVSGENSFHPIFHPWWAVPERDEKWYKTKAKDMELWQLHQEYPASADEAFIGSGSPFYDLVRLQAMQSREPLFVGDIHRADAARWNLIDGQDGLGPFRIWEFPESGRGYAVGADIAQGLEHGDWSVAYVIDKESGDVVAKWRGKVPPDEFADILAAIGWYFNTALLAPEANNHGRSTIDLLRRAGYKNIYRRRTKLKSGGESPTDTIGWLTTRVTKYDVCIQLGQWLRDHNVPDWETVAELRQFRQTQKGEMTKLQGSPHDDQVMALAIAVEARKYAVKHNIRGRTPEDTPGTLAWHVRQLGKKRERKKIRSRL